MLQRNLHMGTNSRNPSAETVADYIKNTCLSECPGDSRFQESPLASAALLPGWQLGHQRERQSL